MSRIQDVLQMIRFSHTLFALPFALLAAVMAWTTPANGRRPPEFLWEHLLGIVLCMVCARSAAMAVNRLADRELDACNPRTKERHLPSGRLSVGYVTGFVILCSIGFVLSTLLFLPNWLPVALSGPVLLFLFVYSFTKRMTSLAHFWLGAALMMSPVCVWVALRGEILLEELPDILPSIMLGGGVLLWVAGFDIIYACQDYDADLSAKLHSVPVAMGIDRALKLAAVCHAAMIGVLALLPVLCPPLRLGWIYGSGVVLMAGLLLYEHSLVRADDLTRVNLAFFHVNSVVSVGLFLIGSFDLLT